jgi:quercetin dioxygenase-like cupin family protein
MSQSSNLSPHFVPSSPSEALENALVPKRDIGGGVMLQILVQSQQLNAVHWNLPDGSVVPLHHHVQEQFGYVIRGALEVHINDDPGFLVQAGDAYLIPSMAPHHFKTVGITEAIDVFAPPRDLSSVGGVSAPAETPVEPA